MDAAVAKRSSCGRPPSLRNAISIPVEQSAPMWVGVNRTVFMTPMARFPELDSKTASAGQGRRVQKCPSAKSPYCLNLDLKKLLLSTQVQAAGGAVQAAAGRYPWIVGAGIGLRF